MPERLRVGLLGCGRIARMFHLPTLAGLDTARLVAVADADPALLAAARGFAPQAAPYADYHTLLAHAEVDAVVVCLPTHLHAEAAEAALARGLHTYVEKPLAAHVDDGARVVTAWRRSGAVGMVGLNFRFHPGYRQVRHVVAENRLGQLVAARMTFCSAPRELPTWKRERVTGGGALLDLVSHQADLVRMVFAEEVTTVTASVRSVRSEDDTAAVTLTLASGLPVQLLASISAPAEDRMEVVGDEAALRLDRFRSRRVRIDPAHPGGGRVDRVRRGLAFLGRTPAELRDVLVPPGEPSFATALHAFTVAAARGAQATPTIADGYRSLRVVAAAEESSRTGAAVSVHPRDDAA